MGGKPSEAQWMGFRLPLWHLQGGNEAAQKGTRQEASGSNRPNRLSSRNLVESKLPEEKPAAVSRNHPGRQLQVLLAAGKMQPSLT